MICHQTYNTKQNLGVQVPTKAILQKTVALFSDTNQPSNSSTPEGTTYTQHLHMATVAGVAVGAIGIVIMITTLLCIVRWKRLRRKPLNLWTVELRDDHENVNFSQVGALDSCCKISNQIDS